MYIRRIFFLCTYIKFSKYKSFIICEIVTSSWPQKIQGTRNRVESLEGEVEIKVANIACHGDGNPSPFPNLSLERTCSWGGPSLLGVDDGKFQASPRVAQWPSSSHDLLSRRGTRPPPIWQSLQGGDARSVQRLFHE